MILKKDTQRFQLETCFLRSLRHYREAYYERQAQAAVDAVEKAKEKEENGKRLFRCAMAGDIETLEEAIWAGADVNSKNTKDMDKTALHYACLRGKAVQMDIRLTLG